ncbi:HAD family hydrolase [Pseudonocardiaceae bacterium YIM PH 21723]|nr:HAD family hydrolase [Pseudonocardiaceae bacterium YIM PH 21723]
MHCAALLFDNDGVLVDSTALIEAAIRDWAAWRQVDADEAVRLSHGRRFTELIPEVAPHLDAAAERIWILDREATTRPLLQPIPGARELTAALPADRWAIVTSAHTPTATDRLHHAGITLPRHLVGGEQLSNGKPDPEGYLKAAALLGFDPADCVVVEDAPAGVGAALAAGMRCVGIGPQVAGLAGLVARLPDLTPITVTGESWGLRLVC